MIMGSGHIICYIILWEFHGEIYFIPTVVHCYGLPKVLVKTRESSKFVQQEYLIRNSHHLKLGMYLAD